LPQNAILGSQNEVAPKPNAVGFTGTLAARECGKHVARGDYPDNSSAACCPVFDEDEIRERDERFLRLGRKPGRHRCLHPI